MDGFTHRGAVTALRPAEGNHRTGCHVPGKAEDAAHGKVAPQVTGMATLVSLAAFRCGERCGLIVVDGTLILGGALAIGAFAL